MKILQLIQKPQFRGAEIFACQLSNHLETLGHEVLLVSLLEGAARLPFKGKHVALKRPLAKRFYDIHGWRQLSNIVKEYNPDILQANAGDTLKFAALSKRIFRWQSPIVFRNANKVSDFINSKAKLFFNKWLIGQLDHVASVSELCKIDFIETYGYSQSRITTVPIGIDCQEKDRNLPEDLRSIFNSGKILVNIASFVPEKNHFGLLRIIKKVIAEFPETKLVLLGDGKLRTDIENEIRRLELSSHVFLLGYREDVLSILPHAHALVLPSKIEGLPGVILEAMCSEVPVIAYDVGGISEVVRHGQTGWLITANDEEAFTEGLKSIYNFPHLDKIRQDAHKLVVAQYSNKVIAGRFLKLYEKVISE